MKLRSVNTHFWDDVFIQDLEPLHKLLFLYLITNPLCNLAGIYEISIRRLSHDTGMPEETVAEILTYLEDAGKVYYHKGHVIMANFLKNQRFNKNMIKGVESVLNEYERVLKGFEPFERVLKGFKGLPNDSESFETVRNGSERKKKEEGRKKKEEGNKKKEEKVTSPGGEASQKKDFNDLILDVFCEEFKVNRGYEFSVVHKGKERQGVGDLLKSFKENNKASPNKPNSEETLEEFRKLFRRALNIRDKWHFDKMSPSHLAANINEIKAKIKSNGVNSNGERKFPSFSEAKAALNG